MGPLRWLLTCEFSRFFLSSFYIFFSSLFGCGTSNLLFYFLFIFLFITFSFFFFFLFRRFVSSSSSSFVCSFFSLLYFSVFVFVLFSLSPVFPFTSLLKLKRLKQE